MTSHSLLRTCGHGRLLVQLLTSPVASRWAARERSRKWSKGGSTTVVTADVELGETAESEGGKWMRVGHGSAPEGVARKIGGRFLK